MHSLDIGCGISSLYTTNLDETLLKFVEISTGKLELSIWVNVIFTCFKKKGGQIVMKRIGDTSHIVVFFGRQADQGSSLAKVKSFLSVCLARRRALTLTRGSRRQAA